jgi:hypothetical protein
MGRNSRRSTSDAGITRNARQLVKCNYREISPLNVCYKVLINILHKQLVPYAEEDLGDY